MDYQESALNFILMKVGVSGVKGDVIVGGHDFLFLGQAHGQSVSGYLNIEVPSLSVMKEAVDIHKDASSIMGIPIVIYIAPSKASVYPESLSFFHGERMSPMEHVPSAIKDNSIAFTNRGDFIKNKHEGLLYYKWDTHWNLKGAYLGYLQLMEGIESVVGIKYQTISDLNYSYTDQPAKGDLGRFLKFDRFNSTIYNQLAPLNGVPILANPDQLKTPISISHLDSDTFEVVRNGEELPNQVLGVRDNTLIDSSNALNDATVLWLKDSFGANMSMQMYKTFSKIYQVHPVDIDSEEDLKILIGKVKPDLIVYTLTERHSFDLVGRVAPMLFSFSSKSKDFNNECRGRADLNDIQIKDSLNLKDLGNRRYRSVTDDPMISVALDEIRNCKSLNVLGQIQATEQSVFQVFYRTKSEDFSEERSVHVLLQSGSNQININLPNDSDYLRIDPVANVQDFYLSDLKISGGKQLNIDIPNF
jgi:hypothetical protein